MLRGFLDGSIKPESGRKISFFSVTESDEKLSEPVETEGRPVSPKPFSAHQKKACPAEVRNAFAVLGLSEEADFHTSRKVYYTLLKQCHPDRSRGNNAEYAQRRTAALNSAWETVQKFFRESRR